MKALIHPTKEKINGRKVVIIRHGTTLANEQDVIRGWWDLPLVDKGLEEAQELGEIMKKSGIELDGIFTSDLLRSVQTTLEISRATGIPLLGTTKVLRPWDVGKLTGTDGKAAHKVMSTMAKKSPDEAVGETGESFNIFRHRFLGGLIGLLNSHRGLKLGFTSHSRGERILHAWVAEGCPDDLSIDLDTFLAEGEPPASAQELVIDCSLVLS